MSRLLFACALFVPLIVFAAEDQSAEEKILTELKMLAGPIDSKKAASLDAEEIKELLAKRGERALELVTKLEKDFAKSKSLNDARLLALKAISHTDTLATDKDPIALAKRLRESTEKGSDHAAQADMFLVGADIRLALRAANSSADFSKAWNKNADAFRKKIETYLDDHPKYRPAADALQGLVPLLDLAGDTKTRNLIIERVAKNLPTHPLARAAALHKAVGKKFDFKFTPVGGNKAVSLADLRGKVVVVTFWASWCQPCITELRQLKSLYEKHNKEGLEIIGVSLDDKDASALRFIKRHKIEWRQVVGKEARALGEEYGIESVPVELLIDREGKLVTVEALGKLPMLLPKVLEKKE